MWPFKFNKSSDDDGYTWETKSVPISTLARWYMYDLDVADANKLAVALDLTPVSEEGDEKERQDSEVRVQRVEGLMPFMRTLAEINSVVVFNVQKQELPKELAATLENAGPDLEQLVRFYESMSFAAILTAFSIGAELGLLDVSSRFTTLD